MSWKVRIDFSDGESEYVEDDFETEEAAMNVVEEWYGNWETGKETLMLAGEEYIDSEIIGYSVWEE